MITTFNVDNTFSTSGNLNMLTDGEAVCQCLDVLLKTSVRELEGDPSFGSILLGNTFQQMNDMLKDIVFDDITGIIYKYDKRIVVNSLNLEYTNNNEMNIDISFYFQSQLLTSTISFNIGD